MGIRDARPADNNALVTMELAAVQGTGIRLATRRSDYFCRAAQFPGYILLVAENDKTGHLQGVMGAAPVRVMFGGEEHLGAYIFDWRSVQVDGKGLSLAMFRLWQELEKRLLNAGVEFLFGYVKKDNLRSADILQRAGARIVGTRRFFLLPVFRTKRPSRAVELVCADEMDWAEDWRHLVGRYGRDDLFPVREARDENSAAVGPLFDPRGFKGQLRAGESRAKIWDDSAQQEHMVVDLPPLYRAVRPIARAVSRLLPLPRIPLPGETVKTWQLFDLEVGNVKEIMAILAHANNLARGKGVDYLIVSADAGEPELSHIGRGALYALPYHLLVKSYVNLPPRADRAYLDIRCV